MVNIDPDNQTARPTPAQLAGIPYVRYGWRMRNFGYGNIDAAFNFYYPYTDALLDAGHKVIIVLTHETWGEGQPGINWDTMDIGAWAAFIPNWVNFIGSIVQRFAGRGVIWQVWNEPDSVEGIASVRMTPYVYGRLFKEAKARIDQLDPSGKVITAGMNSGVPGATNYVKAANIAPDGIALHEYGRGAAAYPHYRPIGTIEEALANYRSVFPSIPLYLTEFGVLNAYSEPVDRVAGYASHFIRAAKPFNPISINYFAWGKQHNGYPVINDDGSIRIPLLNAIKTGAVTTPTDPPDDNGLPVYRFGAAGNFRDAPGIASKIFFELRANEDAGCYETSFEFRDGYVWKKYRARGVDGWVAHRKNVHRWLVRGGL